MIRWLLGVLLHHTNRNDSSPLFYGMKTRILKRWGSPDGYDVQRIHGKKCFSCGGSGIYLGHYRNGNVYHDTCNRCYRGWYKRSVWIILERWRLGGYVFHQPWKQVYEGDETTHLPKANIIDGYIEHKRSKWGKEAAFILFMLFEPKMYWKSWRNTVGRHWRSNWYYPRNWIYTIAHFIRYGISGSYPVVIRRERRKRKENTEELPF